MDWVRTGWGETALMGDKDFLYQPLLPRDIS
jgi:hypothetical protein